jgi:hypothetical protein
MVRQLEELRVGETDMAKAFVITREERADDHYIKSPCAAALSEEDARRALIELAEAFIRENKLPQQNIELCHGIEPTDICAYVGGATFEASEVPLIEHK